MYNDIAQPLRAHAQAKPDQAAYIFHHYPSDRVETRTYGALHARACIIAHFLMAEGLSGQRVILLFSPQLAFVDAFFGCLYAKAIPIPLSPPVGNRELDKMAKIVAESAAAAILTASDLFDICTAAVAGFAGGQLQVIDVDRLIDIDIEQVDWPIIAADDIAFIQYTSGSTGNPKGVMISHANIVYNEMLIQDAFEHNEQTTVVGWLPMFHDMGLIGNILQPMYLGVRCILLSPIAFVQKPVRWLQLISHYKATTAGSPNFGYSLCARRVTLEEKIGLDLSSWTLAFTGAEPIRHNTIEVFCEAFAPCGFERHSFYPCYGLAESTLFVTGIKKQNGLNTRQLDKQAMFQSIVQLASSPTDGISLVSSGFPRHDVQVKIVDVQTCQELAPQCIGEIWISSRSNAIGYWKQALLSEETLRAKLAFSSADEATTLSFLRTGDLGFLHEGELYVVGRLKDIIIIRGKNYYPQDIESTIETELMLSPDSTAAFSVDIKEQECLVVMVELSDAALEGDHDIIKHDINEIVTKTFGIAPYDTWCVSKKSLPRGTSGKLQRFMCRKKYLSSLKSNV